MEMRPSLFAPGPIPPFFSRYVLGVISLSPVPSENCFADEVRVRTFDRDHSRGWEQSARAELGHGAALERSFPWTPWQVLGGFPWLCWGRGWAEQSSSMQPRTATNTLTAIPLEHGNVQHN